MRTTLATGMVLSCVLLATSCKTETSPSKLPESLTAPSSIDLSLASSSALVNLEPLCPGARSPGFFCQNQNGKNPNMPPGEFELIADDAGSLLQTVGAFADITLGEAVCLKGNRLPQDQLLRHLATLAPNLAANLIDETTLLTDGSTVGDALTEAIRIANDMAATRAERNAIKDVLDQINNNLNTILGEDCGGLDG